MNGKLLIVFVVCIVIIAVIVIIKSLVLNNVLNSNSTKELELTYEINAGIPFKREYEVEDNNIAEFARSYVVRDDNKCGIVGASVYTNYVFKGLKEGTTKITFKYVNFTTGEVFEERTHVVKVDKDNNIFEVK